MTIDPTTRSHHLELFASRVSNRFLQGLRPRQRGLRGKYGHMADGALILLVRHGQTAANLSGVLQGQQDHPLNATGRLQAAELAAALRRRRQADKSGGAWAVLGAIRAVV